MPRQNAQVYGHNHVLHDLKDLRTKDALSKWYKMRYEVSRPPLEAFRN